MITPVQATRTVAFLLLATAPAYSQFSIPENWIEETKLTAYDAAANDYYGGAVAIDGDTALVGAWGDEDWGARTGSAYVYVRTGSTWNLQAKLFGISATVGDKFGEAVALSGDVAVIGAWGDDTGGIQAGAAYVFERVGTAWIQREKLLAGDPAETDFFGGEVAIGGDWILVGATGAAEPYYRSGAVYTYERNGASWDFKGKFSQSNPGNSAYFGTSISIDGDQALIGASGQGTGGRAYIFQRAGDVWTQQAILGAGDLTPWSWFGVGVALSGDIALVGAFGDMTAGSQSGAAYVFTGSGASWTPQEKLMPSDGAAYDYFGLRVALDGERAVIGSDGDTDSCPGGDCRSGSAYVYTRSGTRWSEVAKLRPGDAVADAEFGSSVAIDDETILIGATGDPHAGPKAGSAYVFGLLPPPGVGYCFGDPGVDTPCPCDNDNDGSVPGSGCDNGVFASGARLTGLGVASVSDDSLVLTTTGLEPNNSGLYFQGEVATNGGLGVTFGDGLRCAGGSVTRLQVRFCDAEGVSSTTIPIGTKGGVAAGDTRFYQTWYRNQSTPACGLGVNEFNLSNGYEVIWGP